MTPTPEAVAEFVARVRRERAAKGQPPTITSPDVYRALADAAG